MERRLVAILAADVVGYSRLIGADEAGTLAMLHALLKDLVEPTLNSHRGRIVKLMGDGLLAEFASVVDAVSAAVDIQEGAPALSRIWRRISASRCASASTSAMLWPRMVISSVTA